MSNYLSQILYTFGVFVFFMMIVFITYRRGAKDEYDNIGQQIVDDDDAIHLENVEDAEETEGQVGSDHHNGAKNE